MALFPECRPQCAQTVLDTADIVRDGDVTTGTQLIAVPPAVTVAGTCATGRRAVAFGIMRPAPKWTEFPKYPVIAGTAILAIAVTIGWWSKLNVSPLFETAMIRRGELWRLITGIFPHADILHLTFNIYWLWVFGTLVERVYGHLRAAALIALFALGSGSLEFAFALG